MVNITAHNATDIVLGSVTIASVVYRFIPSPEQLNDWPRLQGWYKLFYVFIRAVAFGKTNGNGGSNGNSQANSGTPAVTAPGH